MYKSMELGPAAPAGAFFFWEMTSFSYKSMELGPSAPAGAFFFLGNGVFFANDVFFLEMTSFCEK